MPEVEQFTIFPVKGLDGTTIETAKILTGGTIEYDREFAFFDENGNVLNGKRTASVHQLQSEFEPDTYELTVETPAGERRTFTLDSEYERTEKWFGEYFGTKLELRRDRSLGYVDRRGMGPSVISTATLETVASWFEEMTVQSARRRLRANIEISGVPPFWEDRFVGEDAPTFDIGDITFEGVTPCGRCVVPQRNPDTGDPLPEFQQQFVRNREETFPEWGDPEAFDHFYTLMIITRVPESQREQTLDIGDRVSVDS